MEDDAQKMLRVLQEDRQVIIDTIIGGTVSAENVPNGYRHMVGMIAAYDTAINRVYEVFAGWLPNPPKGKEPPKRPMGDY